MRTLRRQRKETSCLKTGRNPGPPRTGQRTIGEDRHLQVGPASCHWPPKLGQPDLACHLILSVFFVLILWTEYSHF